MKSMYEQILHLLNLDLTPVCKGAFCCPLHSHASVFSVSEQTGTSRALDGKFRFELAKWEISGTVHLSTTMKDQIISKISGMCIWFVRLSDFDSSTNYHVAA